jgi:uncharacterized protein (TIRG00374 family)
MTPEVRSHYRAIIVLALAGGLLALFLRNVDLRQVAVAITQAQPVWLALSLATTIANLAVRSARWQYLLEPLGHASFGNAFRATAVGFAASAVLPARAGEVIRPYFLSRHEPMSATGAFATIILERLLDTITVLVQLGAFVLFFGDQVRQANPSAFVAVKWAGASAGTLAVGVLVVLFLLAGDPARLGRMLARLERIAPLAVATILARVAEKFATGLGVVRRPGRLLMALLLSFPLWLLIDLGIWAIAAAFGLAVPFTGSFLVLAFLVLGVAVPTPGAIGGFDAAFRFATTTFYGATDGASVAAALVLHAFSFGPSLLLGLVFAAGAGMNLSRMRQMADAATEQENPA